MEDEVLRLAEVSWFLKEFYRYCRKEYPSASIDKSVYISQSSVTVLTLELYRDSDR